MGLTLGLMLKAYGERDPIKVAIINGAVKMNTLHIETENNVGNRLTLS